jgi:hypothetical protein
MIEKPKILITRKYPAAGINLLKKERSLFTFWEINEI